MTGVAYKWQFASRFRRHAFGWRSDTPIQRIKEALAEIKQVARKEPVLAAEGAVTLLEKFSPALEQVDSSSGALGSAVNKAIETLVPLIVKANVEPKQRQRWLDRLADLKRIEGALQGLVERCCAASGEVQCPLIAALQAA